MKKPHYYYKFLEKSILGQQMQDYVNKCIHASELAREWALLQGASSYYESPNGMAGGIIAVEFEATLSKEGWERVALPDGMSYFIPTPDTDLEREMFALPIISEMELIRLMKCQPRKSKSGKPLPMTLGNTTPVFFQNNGYWFVDMPYECVNDDLFFTTEKDFSFSMPKDM